MAASNAYVYSVADHDSIVEYHGSITRLHGRFRLRSSCCCEECFDSLGDYFPLDRYVLVPIPGVSPTETTELVHVRPESFTITVPPPVRA